MLFLLFLSFLARAEVVQVQSRDDLTWSEKKDNYIEEQKRLCSEPPSDKWRIIQSAVPYESLLIPASRRSKMNFGVKKKGKNSYELGFHVRFRAGKRYDGKGTYLNNLVVNQNKVHEIYVETARNCAKKYSGKIRDKEGNTFDLVFNDPQMVSQLPRTDIRIVSSDSRSNMKAYQSNVPCEIILHELLHVAGLADEYAETVTTKEGYKKNSTGAVTSSHKTKVNWGDCRVPGQVNNIMQFEQHFKNMGEKNLKILTCICIDQKRCVEPKSTEGLKACPADYTNDPMKYPHLVEGLKAQGAIKDGVYYPAQASSGEGGIYSGDPSQQVPVLRKGFSMSVEVEDPLVKIPLSNAQARHLIYPGCDNLNRKYYTCSNAAYETSVERGCPQLPQYCHDGTWQD